MEDMPIVNLWQEINDVLEENGKTWEDVKSIYGEKYQITKENFKSVARASNYHRISETLNIPWDLRIRGNDFIMFIDHVDYVVKWVFKSFEKDPPKKFKEIFYLESNEDLLTLDEMNQED